MSNVYLTGNYAPVEDEVTVAELHVIGQVPSELNGRYVRNGPNPIHADPRTYHWFLGDGMVHGVRLGDGQAHWYRNRWIRSDAVREHLGEPPSGEPIQFSSNTSVARIGGRTLAIVEGGAPAIELTHELGTVSRFVFEDESDSWFTAHPKHDPVTGLWHAVTYGPTAPFVGYKVVDAQGRVVHDIGLDVGSQPMIHDAAITETRLLVFVSPILFNLDLARSGHVFPYAWSASAPSRVGVMPLGGKGDEIVWCELPEARFLLHTMNAFDLADGRIQLDAVVASRTMAERDVHGPSPADWPVLERWIVDPPGRRVLTAVLDDRRQEFPRINETLTGRPARFGYSVWQPDFVMGTSSLLKSDLQAGTTEVHGYGDDRATDEVVFVPRSSATDEDDGWLLSFVFDGASGTSELVILHSQDLGGEPVARVVLPRRVPHGFHGAWLPD